MGNNINNKPVGAPAVDEEEEPKPLSPMMQALLNADKPKPDSPNAAGGVDRAEILNLKKNLKPVPVPPKPTEDAGSPLAALLANRRKISDAPPPPPGLGQNKLDPNKNAQWPYQAPKPDGFQMQFPVLKKNAQSPAPGAQNDSSSDDSVHSTVLAIPNHLEMEAEDYELNKMIAEGGGGAVYHAELVNGSSKFGIVAKLVHIEHDVPTRKQMDMFFQEIALMYRFRKCSNIVKLYGFDVKNVTILVQYYAYGSLTNWIKGKVKDCLDYKWSRKIFLPFLQDIARGIKFMHKDMFAHCDLKPDNVLIERAKNRYRAVISDFGLSRILDRDRIYATEFKTVDLRGASIAYAAPEALVALHSRQPDHRDGKIIKTADIYSIGCIIYECLNRARPWKVPEKIGAQHLKNDVSKTNSRKAEHKRDFSNSGSGSPSGSRSRSRSRSGSRSRTRSSRDRSYTGSFKGSEIKAPQPGRGAALQAANAKAKGFPAPPKLPFK